MLRIRWHMFVEPREGGAGLCTSRRPNRRDIQRHFWHSCTSLTGTACNMLNRMLSRLRVMQGSRTLRLLSPGALYAADRPGCYITEWYLLGMHACRSLGSMQSRGTTTPQKPVGRGCGLERPETSNSRQRGVSHVRGPESAANTQRLGDWSRRNM